MIPSRQPSAFWRSPPDPTGDVDCMGVLCTYYRSVGADGSSADCAESGHPPSAEKILEWLIGLLSGIEYLSDLSEGAAPLGPRYEVARAWQLQGLADASGVSRTLRACDQRSVQDLQAALDTVSQPFLARAIADLRQHDEVLVLDVELTGRPISSTSESFPGAAFGYMDGEVRLGYQLAEICLQSRLYGRQLSSAI